MTFKATVAFPSVQPRLAQRMQAFHSERLPGLEILPLPGHRSFFDAWEAAIDRASFDVLILTHEDVRILGLPDAPLANRFEAEPGLGMMGVAGTKEIRLPDYWWFSRARYKAGLLSGEVYHDDPQTAVPQKMAYGPFGRVVVLDGVCLITTRERLAGILPACRRRAYAAWDFYDHVVSLEFVKAGYYHRTCDLKLIHDSDGMVKRRSFMIAAERFVGEYLIDADAGTQRSWSV